MEIEEHSFDLGIESNSENIFILIVKDSLEKNVEVGYLEEDLEEGEVTFYRDVGVRTKQTKE